jgi:hypothetical protein
MGLVGSLLETLQDGVAVVDSEGRLKGYNSAYLRQFDLQPGDLRIGDTLETMLSRIAERGGLSAGLSREAAIRRRLAAWGTPEDRRERRYLANGRVQDIFRSHTEEGDIVSVHVDVTESVRRDRELELQRLYMESILENIADGVTMVDADGRFIAFNRRFLELYRVDPSAVRWGMHASELGPLFGELADAPEEEARAAREERIRFAANPEETRIQRRLLDGRVLDVKKAVLPGGGCVMTIREITEDLARRRELEEARARAEEHSRHKSQFLARMSHEIRTPLNGVLGVAALLEQTALDAHQRELVRVIVGSGEMLVRLIDDILDLSRIEAGRISLREEPFEICRVMRESVGLIEPLAADKGLRVLKDPSPVPPPAMIGDPVRLKQVLLNLLGNAIKFTEEGSVTIGLRVAPGETDCTAEIRISDTGVGIPAGERAAVFDNFYRGQSGRPRDPGGAGLGLAVAKGLVEAMGGRIWIDEGGGEAAGTTFRLSLTLPLADAPAVSAAGAATP